MVRNWSRGRKLVLTADICRLTWIRTGSYMGTDWSSVVELGKKWEGGARRAHAHSAGNAIENGQLCRAVLKTGWTRPLGTSVVVRGDGPGE